MFYLIAFIVFSNAAILEFAVWISKIYYYGFKKTLKSISSMKFFLLGVICVVMCFPVFNLYKREIQTNAIDHYIVGDVELVEKRVNGEVVDWYYIVTPVDYE